MKPSATAELPQDVAVWRGKLGFGVGALGVSLIYSSVAVLLLYFYTHVMGLTAGQAGTILFFGAVGDAVLDPIVGWLASKTRTRWGRYRPYLLFGAVPLSFAYIACFYVPPIRGEAHFLYALISLTVFRAAFQLIYMPYTSLIVVLSSDPDERSDIEGWRAWFVAAGNLAIGFGALSMVGWLGGGDDRIAFLRLSALIALTAAAAFVFTGLVTVENHVSGEDRDESNLKVAARLLARNDQFWVVIGAIVLSQSAYAMVLSGTVPYFDAVFGNRTLSRWPLSAMNIAGLLASFLWPVLSRRFGKRKAWITGLLLSACSLLFTYTVVPVAVVPFAAAYFVFGCGIQSANVIQFAAAADALDYGEWKNGLRVEAIGFATITFAMKLSLAIGNGLIGWCYEYVGYRPRGSANLAVQSGMEAVLLCMPAALLIGSAVITNFFSISAGGHRLLIRQIAERRAAMG